ncbi:hypothetical protein ID852_01355 [Xenorhabdus sp. 42]|uniref:hypothetical protein n=1 Tax=Xenorhabdus szentirmaii TaxID=290112 RepID=UPI0019827F79|nr:hypothetical protein [Xenorhabdus sp. 42]MBD2819362.1 hypothetical protein [Xenorhabdus sp. 42]
MDNTWQQLMKASRLWSQWCIAKGRPYLPITCGSICRHCMKAGWHPPPSVRRHAGPVTPAGRADPRGDSQKGNGC